MPEDAGKKKLIKDLLIAVQRGEGFIEDIWIERVIKLPGTEGEGSTARSLSGRKVNNITQLLEDDLQNCFDDGYFTFRFISAIKGSGKTSLLTYLHQLTKTKPTYEKLSVVCRFPLSDVRSIAIPYNFSIKFYCYILAQTFWELLNNTNILIKNGAKNILSDYLENNELSELIIATKPKPFCAKFNRYLANTGVIFEDLLFELIYEVSRIEPQFTFAYLVDELDSLEKYPNDLQETRSIIKALIKRVSQQFRSKIRLLIYIVGTSENIKSFIDEDSVLESLVSRWVINLNTGYGNEFEMIRSKIDARIEGAFKGYKNFSQAWQDIKNIPLNPAQNLRSFCQEYATAVIEIHEKHFREEPEKSFEGNARQLVEAQCRQKWQTHLNKKSYTLSSVSTTTVLEGHAFDCYIELHHNNSCVARAFGEAKNYELLSGHLETFNEWLEDVKFKPSNTDGTPPDLAFIIAPSCPSLLQRKLELKNICFIESNKVVTPVIEPDETINITSGVDINTAEKDLIVNAFKGTAIKKTTIDRLMQFRSNKNYKNLDELAADLKLTQNAKQKLQKKVDDGKICFSAPSK